MKTLYTVIAFLLLSLYTDGQEQLTLEGCRDMALEHNKKLQIIKAQTQGAEYKSKSLKSNYFPKFSANALYLWNNEDINLKTSAIPLMSSLTIPPLGLGLDVAHTFHAGISLTQPLYTGGKIRSSNRAAQYGTSISLQNEHRTRNEIIVECDKAYWNCVKAENMKKLALKYAETIEEVLRNISNAYKIGLKSENDVLKVKVKLNEAELNILKAENACRLSNMYLCQIIGLPLKSDIRTDADILEKGFGFRQQDCNASLKDREEYRMLANKVKLFEEQIRFVRSDFLPSAAVSVGYGYTNGINLKGTTPASKKLFKDGKLCNSGSVTAIASLKIPIFHWGEGRNKIKAAQEEQRAAALELEEVYEKIQLEAEMAENALSEAGLEVQMTESSVLQARENLKISTSHYNKGMETLANLLEAQTIWQQAETDNINSKILLRIAEIDYLRVLGKL